MYKVTSFVSIIVFVLLSTFVCAAQGTKPTSRTTTTTTQPKSDDVKIISLAEDEPMPNAANTQPDKKKNKRNAQPESEQEYLRRTIGELATEISSLSERVAQMEEKQQQLIDLEILSRAEARAELLHQQLFETLTKEAELKGKLAQVEYDSRPEIIERTMSIIGSTRPEDLRDARRQQLQAEKYRIQEQLLMIQQNRLRLELAVTNADLLVERLRNRIEEALDNPVPQRTKPKSKPTDKTDSNNPDEIKPPSEN
jgi:hypothetical protein